MSATSHGSGPKAPRPSVVKALYRDATAPVFRLPSFVFSDVSVSQQKRTPQHNSCSIEPSAETYTRIVPKKGESAEGERDMPPQMVERVQRLVAEMLEEHGWTLREAYDKTGIDHATLTRVRKGKSIAGIHFYMKLRKAIGIRGVIEAHADAKFKTRKGWWWGSEFDKANFQNKEKQGEVNRGLQQLVTKLEEKPEAKPRSKRGRVGT